jgi:hypothetical protein
VGGALGLESLPQCNVAAQTSASPSHATEVILGQDMMIHYTNEVLELSNDFLVSATANV